MIPTTEALDKLGSKSVKRKPAPAASQAAAPPSDARKCAVATCKRPARRTHGAGFLCPFHFVRLPEGTQHVLPYLLRRPETDAERLDVLEAAVARIAAEDAGARLELLTKTEWESADELTREFTAFPSFEALLTAKGGYWPKLPCRRREPGSQRAQLLANFYDREQTVRGDARRATRVGSCGL